MTKVTIFTGSFCPYCMMAKRLLKQVGVEDIEEINRDTHPDQFEQAIAGTGQRTIPQIFIGDTHVGGFTDLYALHQRGELLPLLQNN
ncbi:glutaredoxin 3 [Alysiella crassa]|uniref:Glutaredoxin n=1 Tax=Alysiella crassa TaxID=153491 RepID=A0A376BNE4_9NEIS|nr:glutaredoxin 3 [Alysiella crassa]UOP07106.1 glutaredoxin 3 [Alysiella crassa]SSY70744.1 Glutaredoxin-3 [Alysiella crassa]